ncbi:MAG: polA2 [Paenibacillus sp.]|nr:polA2 [Paenibacillus sp.]
MEKLILIDGNSIASRAFYALPLLSNSSGLHTNAVFGFTTMLLKLIEEEKPTHFLVAFDAGKVTFRHADYKDYKGGRAKTPPELSEQFPLIRELVQSFGIPQFELPGYEADDIIGTMTRLADERGLTVIVVSGDKDMLQLASEHVTIALTRKGVSEVDRYTPEAISEKYGLVPKQIIDLKGLMGDASDNIPGIPGVGEKTALKLLHQYGSVEEVLAKADEITGKMQDKIKDHAEDARMSKELATIYREVPMEMKLDELHYEGYEGPTLGAMFRKLEFKSLLDKMDLSAGAPSPDEGTQTAIEIRIVTKESLGVLADDLHDVEAVHIEIVGDNPHVSDLIGISLFTSKGISLFVPAELLDTPEAGALRDFLADEHAPKIVYDMHRTEVALHWKGVPLRGVAFDVLIAAYLLDPTESTHTLNELAGRYKLSPVPADEDVYGKGAKFKVPEVGRLSEHISRKAELLARLVPILKDELEKNEMNRLYYELEFPLARVLASMEKQGILVNAEGLKQLGGDLGKAIEKLAEGIYRAAGMEFNLNSPKQLGEILFDKLGLPVVKKTKTGYSTDAEVLEKLAPYHEVVSSILNYRQLAKLQSTYVEGLLKEIREETGKVHTYYQQTIAATGRLSSQFPNLQNIPIRGDKNLKEAFLNDMDVHTKTAMDVFGVSEAEVDSNMRRQAKAVNFGIVYGISDYGLSQNLNITRKEAAQFIEQYFAVFQGVRQYMDDIVKQARANGYVTTLLQRRRYLPEINASNFNLRSFAERTAMNSPIQGSAADIIKLAMVQIAERMNNENVRSRMLLQVHDELVFEVPQEELEMMKRLVPEVMEGALALDVPLKVDVNYGENWYEAK